jgi:Domain of unknown function (DUF4129)
MPGCRFATALLLICLCLSAAASAAVGGRPFSVGEYTAELDRLSTLANQAHDDSHAADAALEELHGDWKVESDGQVFDINKAAVVDQFETLKKNPDSDTGNLLERLATMKTDAQGLQQTPTDSSSVRSALTQILARSEFHQVHGPTWFDRLKTRIISWIVRLLTVAFGSSSAPVVGRVFVWLLVAIAVVALAWFIYREMKRNARRETIMPEVLPVSAKKWRVWIEEAQAAAAKGLWRDAVHLAYWGGISFLEESGMWRPDQARTPREYLRLLPADSQHRTALSTLTRQLEVTWYGDRPAGAETFAETLNHLEELGCRKV